MSKNLPALVKTNAGLVEGRYEDNLYVFKGVPYAAPPVGERRWLPPQPHEPWAGVLKTLEFKDIPPQPFRKLGFIQNFEVEETQSEDCLFLNIWTPGLDNACRPVMVWIHGGYFVMGSGTQSMYRGGALASRGNTVLVTINYRLGSLGFIRLNEVTNGKIPSSGNEGLIDQIAALEWIRSNIYAFGGDPSNVTVFGESAGGMSIECLLAMPGARGLFHKAILQSSVGNTARQVNSAVRIAEQYLDLLGIKDGDAAALRAFPVERILSAQIQLTSKFPGPTPPTIPVIDGEVLPKMPIDTVRSHSSPLVPVLIGTNLEEWKLFSATNPNQDKIDAAWLKQRCRSFVPLNHVSSLIETYRNARKRRGEPIAPIDLYSAILTDAVFRIPSTRLLEACCSNKQDTYGYLFTWKSPVSGGVLGSCHALEIGFLFGTYSNSFCGSGPAADKLALSMQDAWTTFARTGNPSCAALGNWPQYCDSRKTMILGSDFHVTESPYDEERRIWDIIGDISFI